MWLVVARRRSWSKERVWSCVLAKNSLPFAIDRGQALRACWRRSVVSVVPVVRCCSVLFARPAVVSFLLCIKNSIALGFCCYVQLPRDANSTTLGAVGQIFAQRRCPEGAEKGSCWAHYQFCRFYTNQWPSAGPSTRSLFAILFLIILIIFCDFLPKTPPDLPAL